MAKSEEGLSKLLAYLRDVAEQERLAGIEALKPVGTQVRQAVEHCSCNCMHARCNCMCQAQDHMIMHHSLHGTMSQAGSFLEYRIKADVAQRLPGGQEVLDNRCWARSGASLVRLGPRLVVLGGSLLGGGQRTMDAFWAADDRMEWHRQVFASGDCPPARDGHACVIDDTRCGCIACSLECAAWLLAVLQGQAPLE